MRSPPNAALISLFAVALAIAALAVVYQPSQGEVARQPQAATAWEYRVIMAKDLTDIDVRKLNVFTVTPEKQAEITAKVQATLNALGRDGWELCEQLNGGVIFKRPM